MPSDWQRALVALSATVVTTAIVGVLFWARSIFIPITLAIFLAFVLVPVVARLQRIGLGRTTAVITTVGLVICSSLGIGAVVVSQIMQLADTLPDRHEAIKAKVTAAREMVVGDGSNRFGQLVDDVTGIISPKPAQTNTMIVESSSPLTAQLNTYLSPAAEMAGQAAFTFILTVYMLLRREDLRNRMIRLLGAGKVTTTTKAVDDASQRISRYLLSQFIVNSTFGLIIAIGMFALGVKYSILWGFIATIMRYVPYVGTWVGLIPPVLFSFATAPAWGGGWGQPIAVFALFIGLETFCNNVVEPTVYGQSMGLSEVAQLVAAAVWAFLWGPMGLILSGPLTVCILVLGRHVSRFNFWVVLLGDEPALEPRVAFYQRLTAHDQDEAADVAMDEAKKTSAEAVFDTVVIPALCLARRDREEGDLDAADMNYIVTAAREVADEVAELLPAPTGNPNDRVRILLCPARDNTEQFAAELLALTLDSNRWEVKLAGDETLASELVEMVASFRPEVVLITAMPPGGLSHARYLLTRLRQRFPDVKLLVGRWGEETTLESRSEAIRNADGVDRTLAESRKRLAGLHPTLVTTETKSATERANKKEAVGTAGA
jgi:predicted PurR-regulated permease PerM